MKHGLFLFFILIGLTLGVAGCGTTEREPHPVAPTGTPLAAVVPVPSQKPSQPMIRVEFNLRTGVVDGRMAFVGVGGDIDGLINPDLVVQAGSVVHVTVTNGDGMPHDFFVAGLGAQAPMVSGSGATTEVRFAVESDQVGTYSYYCTVAGHRQAGMAGELIVVEPPSNTPP
jgi:nitrite reductase (NO-forming)